MFFNQLFFFTKCLLQSSRKFLFQILGKCAWKTFCKFSLQTWDKEDIFLHLSSLLQTYRAHMPQTCCKIIAISYSWKKLLKVFQCPEIENFNLRIRNILMYWLSVIMNSTNYSRGSIKEYTLRILRLKTNYFNKWDF